jgi:hypothetical protein
MNILGDHKCFICPPVANIAKSPISVDGVFFYKYECKNCGTFFFTEIDENYEEAFADYLLENNKRHRKNHDSGLRMNPSFYNVIFIVSEEQKKTDGFCGKLVDALRSVQGWGVTDEDKINFVTVENVRTMFDP